MAVALPNPAFQLVAAIRDAGLDLLDKVLHNNTNTTSVLKVNSEGLLIDPHRVAPVAPEGGNFGPARRRAKIPRLAVLSSRIVHWAIFARQFRIDFRRRALRPCRTLAAIGRVDCQVASLGLIPLDLPDLNGPDHQMVAAAQEDEIGGFIRQDFLGRVGNQ